LVEAGTRSLSSDSEILEKSNSFKRVVRPMVKPTRADFWGD